MYIYIYTHARFIWTALVYFSFGFFPGLKFANLVDDALVSSKASNSMIDVFKGWELKVDN